MPQPCELCQQAMPALTEHHLIPRQRAKREGLASDLTLQSGPTCRRQIHTLYNNSYLALHLNTLEKLKQDSQLQKFLTWVYKQAPNKMDRKRCT
ncbi:MAG: hypothetical protein ACAF41_28490 [Leptolyngbya sp. BL-A-14]